MIEVQLPDGKTIEIDTDDPTAAASAAKKYLDGQYKQPDKYKAAAIEEDKKLNIRGQGVDPGYARRIMQGATFNAADEILAGLSTPFEMIKRGTWNPAEGYNYAKAREDLILDKARENTGALGTALEIGGGALSGSGLANAGMTAARALGSNPGLLARSLASAADAGLYGGLAGAMEGNGLAERASNAVTGGAMGAAIGGAAPTAISILGGMASPVISNIRARTNPEAFAKSQVARGVFESGKTPQQIADEVALAAQQGQGVYTMADAMGNPGQRLLSTVTRAPGIGRTNAVDFLDARQAGQGRRVTAALAEGFDAPVTANMARTALTTARNDAADVAYDALRSNAMPVNISNVVAKIDETLSPGITGIARPASSIADDSIEGALRKFRSSLTDGRSQQVDFQSLMRTRSELSDIISKAVRAGENNKARMLGQTLRELDKSMESASSGFRSANQAYAQGSRAIEAVDQGSLAAKRGRTEDILATYPKMTPPQQVGFRVGYADPLIEGAQGAAIGANKARPLINDAFQAEAAVIAPNNPVMQQRIGRENTMFETRAAAMGGSKTADNLADERAMGFDPSLVGHVLTGNWTGAIKSALASGGNAMTGNTPAVREEVAKILLQRGQTVSPKNMQAMLDEAVKRIEQVNAVARQLGRGAMAGLAVTPSATGTRR